MAKERNIPRAAWANTDQLKLELAIAAEHGADNYILCSQYRTQRYVRRYNLYTG